MKIRAIIVDDEVVARQVLRSYLQDYCPQVQVITEAQNPKEAVPLILSEKPDLVFLDVEMPYGNAFDVLEQTTAHIFETIFITAYSDYSMQALNESAAYYILKPIDIQELIKAVNKVSETINQQENFSRNEVLLSNLKSKNEKKRLVLPTQYGFDVVDLSEVKRLQADGNFTQVYLKDGSKKLVCRFLKHFDEILGIPFLRVHRSHIVNLNEVKSYQKGNGGVLTLNDQTEIEVSAAYKQALLQAF